jgi:hypothetical protein
MVCVAVCAVWLCMGCMAVYVGVWMDVYVPVRPGPTVGPVYVVYVVAVVYVVRGMPVPVLPNTCLAGMRMAEKRCIVILLLAPLCVYG